MAVVRNTDHAKEAFESMYDEYAGGISQDGYDNPCAKQSQAWWWFKAGWNQRPQATPDAQRVREALGAMLEEFDGGMTPCGDHPAWCVEHQEKPWRCKQKREVVEQAKAALKGGG